MTEVRAARLGGRAEAQPAKKRTSFGETALGVVDSTKAKGDSPSIDLRGKSRVRSRSANQAAVLIERSILTLGTLRICPKKLPSHRTKPFACSLVGPPRGGQRASSYNGGYT